MCNEVDRALPLNHWDKVREAVFDSMREQCEPLIELALRALVLIAHGMTRSTAHFIPVAGKTALVGASEVQAANRRF